MSRLIVEQFDGSILINADAQKAVRADYFCEVGLRTTIF